jgi:hypothetical protein
VQAQVSEWNGETFPMWSVVEYEFPERQGLPPLKWTWYDGGAGKPAWIDQKLTKLAHGMKISDSGSLLIGEKMTLYSPSDYGAQYFLLGDKEAIGPLPDAARFQPPSMILPRTPAEWRDKYPPHFMEFVTACEQNDPGKCFAGFGYSGPLTETVVLGCVALRAGKRIEWDGPNMRITNEESANQLLRRDYRTGWEV